MIDTQKFTETVLDHFKDICKVPRPSKHEERIVEYICQFAQKLNLQYKRDKAGNVLVLKPAHQSNSTKPIIIQSHVDMVCEKNADTVHDFMTDPIQCYIDGEWMKAKGTTLGADDGIGVATMLAILADNTIPHPPLEMLFTVDEETGLTGAKSLEPNFMQGKMLINLDSEDEGQIFIGCAGGIDTIGRLKFEYNPTPKNSLAYEISVKGLRGGHSGDDINKRRGNAIKILNHILLDASGLFGICISEFDGGNLRNAIPREARAVVVLNHTYKEAFEIYCQNEATLWKEALAVTAPDLCITATPCQVPDQVIDIVNQSCLMNTLAVCPSGVVSMSKKMRGLVSTSSNIASVKIINDEIVITTSQRSDNEESKKIISNKVRRLFTMMDATVEQSDGYPGWEPNPNSQLLEVVKASYDNLFDEEPEVRAIHAGLECGLFLEKYPNLDMVSFGPTLRDVHSPDERLHLPSLEKFVALLLDVLNTLK